MKVAATIPAYQAEPWIADVVHRTLAHLPQVVVVDDGSSDATAAAAKEAGGEVLVHPQNLGKGAALRSAFDHLFPNYDAVLTLDADGQHLPEEIPRLLAVPEADLVLGTRDHLFEAMSSVRRTSNQLSSRAISWAAGEMLSDVQTGFRLYTRRLIDAVGFPEDRFEAESAVVVRACRGGFQVVAVPVAMAEVDGRGTSHFRPVTDSLRIAGAVAKARMEDPCPCILSANSLEGAVEVPSSERSPEPASSPAGLPKSSRAPHKA
ncbi:MAG: glycosyltransferase family 2 protein [Acidobacteriota bacterium]